MADRGRAGQRDEEGQAMRTKLDTGQRVIGTVGTLGIADRELVEGSDESRRRAAEARLRENRVAAARAHRRWVELPAERLGREGRWFYDTASGRPYEPVRTQVWSADDPSLVELNGHEVDAFVVQDGDVLFLRKSRTAVSIDDLRWLAQDRVEQAAKRRQEQAEQAERAERRRVEYASAQPLAIVTLGDVEQRELPTVAEAARRILAAPGTITTRDGRIVVELPTRLAQRDGDHDRLHAELADCVRVLVAARSVVVPALESSSRKPLLERLPDAHAAADGGLVA
jgi:hypothetical protein